MLAELLGTDELRELIDPRAVEALEAELQALDDRWRARHADDAHDLLRRLGDLRVDELAARSAADFSAELVASRRGPGGRIPRGARPVAAGGSGRPPGAPWPPPAPGLPRA